MGKGSQAGKILLEAHMITAKSKNIVCRGSS